MNRTQKAMELIADTDPMALTAMPLPELLEKERMAKLAADAGRHARQRTTLYQPVGRQLAAAGE
ncbi:hypothetical protein [Rhizorhapis sp.]|uniref:hypothetical protein n=1 Tax=Rhizorhapis sp. TaxID=1968842 RepID=UPI002B466CE4|nr:hypothetical protein [Rhizorhapis sp.]HKR18377.1 hypothetical protein [Rhizorhapis sp.]